MIVWVTKYALARGIERAYVEPPTFAGVLLCAAMSPLVRAPVHTMVIVGFVAVFFAAVAWAQGRGR